RRDAQTGRVLAMTTYLDGQPHGPEREWYGDGTLKLEGFNEMGRRHGTYRQWYADGRPRTEAFFELSICIQQKEWSPNGELLRSFILTPSDPEYRRLTKIRCESGPLPIIKRNTAQDDVDAPVLKAH
ncbi:MAG: hypothetical protein AAF449_22525, partial [Myxococcota bacterium]